jgi:two-component system OmpR family sensor kinase
MKWWRWAAILAPAVLGLLINQVLFWTRLPNPRLFFLLDLGVLAFLLGVLLSVLGGIGLALWDWTERERLQHALRAAEDRRRFLRRLDHELKNPLTAILVGLANLSAGQDSPADPATLDSVQTQVARLRRLVADLRKLSELETRELERSPVMVGGLLEEVYALAEDREDLDGRQLNLSIPQAPWPLPTVPGDRDLLFLAVHNLVDNALKFTEPGDTLEIRAFEDGSEVVIEVADTGPGIPAQEAQHVWDELYRGEGARGIQGSGLGLALVRAIVARHGGEVQLRSRPGQGTVVTVRLPAGEVTKP